MFNPYCISRGALSTIPEIQKFSWARFPDLPKKLPAITGWQVGKSKGSSIMFISSFFQVTRVSGIPESCSMVILPAGVFRQVSGEVLFMLPTFAFRCF